MLFSSLEFLYLFLPVSLILYFAVPWRAKNPLLLALSLLFYAGGEPVFVLLMMFTIAVDYALGLAIGRRVTSGTEAEKKKAGRLLLLGLVYNLGVLALFKYTSPLFSTLAPIFGKTASAMPQIPLPIGISFYTFQALSYLIDVFRSRVRAQKSLVAFGMYISLFPQLIAGPIVRYSDIDRALTSRTHSVQQTAGGLRLFCLGLAKKVLFANPAGELWQTFCREDDAGATVLGAWLGLCLFALQIYFDFSGYSDMAVGLGRVFGFDFPQNFRYPYITRSVSDFWRRWHITLSSWFREYVYIPLGGNRCGRLRCYRNLLITWLLTGIWHGATLNFALWGLWFFFWIAMEKAFLSRVLDRVPGIFRHGYALAVILFGWLIFAADGTTLTVEGAFRYAGHLFGAGGIPLTSGTVGYEFLRNLLLLVAMPLGATPLPAALFRRFSHRLPRAGQATANLLSVASLLICTAYLVNSGYNPFLYFRF